MAYQLNFDEEETGSPGAGLQGNFIGSANGASDPGAAAPQAQGTGWTNLSTYLDANKGAGGQMAKDVTKETQNKITDLEGAGGKVDAWKQAATQDINKGTKQDSYSQTISKGSTKDIAGIDQNAFNAWNNLAAYTGPQSAQASSGYTDLANQVANTKDKISNLNDYEGQKVALQDTYGKGGNYGSGFQALDAFAMRGDEAGKQTLNDFQQQNANFGQGFEAARAGLDNSIAKARQTGAANAAAVQNATTARINQMNQERANAKIAERENLLKVLGNTTPGLGDRIDVSKYISERQDYNPYAGMSDVDFAALNALAGMSGQTPASRAGSGEAYTTDTAQFLRDMFGLSNPTGVAPMQPATGNQKIKLKG